MLQASSLFTKIGFSSLELASDRRIDCPAVTIYDANARVSNLDLQGDRSVPAAGAEQRETAHTPRDSQPLSLDPQHAPRLGQATTAGSRGQSPFRPADRSRHPAAALC